MAVRRLALCLLLLLLVAGVAPVRAGDFNFTNVPRVTLGLTASESVGAAGICSFGSVLFNPDGSVGGGSAFLCDGTTFPILDGQLTIDFVDRDVFGTIGGDDLSGQLQPAGHAFIAATTFNESVTGGFGLSVFVEPNGVKFGQADLTGAWRVNLLQAGRFPATTEHAFGSLRVSASGEFTGALKFSDSTTSTISGSLSITPDGTIVGFVPSGLTPEFTLPALNGVLALMAPDKNFVGGIGLFGNVSANKSGMFFLQREPPTTVVYTPSDLAGTWQFVGMQGQTQDSGSGTWYLGSLTIGVNGSVIGGLVDAFGHEVAISSGHLTITPQGVINGGVALDTGDVVIHATMFQDKRQIIGVESTSGESAPAVGLFSMLKPPPSSTVGFDSRVYRVNEGDTATIQVDRTGALSTEVTVDYTATTRASTPTSSAASLAAFTTVSGTVTIPATKTSATFRVPTGRDGLVAGDAIVTLSLSNPTNGASLGLASAALTIVEADRGGTVFLSQKAYSVSEGGGNVSIKVVRSGGLAANASVQFTTINGTATAGSDYGAVSQRVVFGANQSSVTVVIPIIQEDIPEDDETFTVKLSDPQGGATLGTPSSAVVTIVEDDSVIELVQPIFSAVEGTTGVITVRRTGNRSTLATVPFNVSADTALPNVDFKPPTSRTLTFMPTQRTATFPILTIDNGRLDGNRSALITLGTPTGGARLGSQSSATFTILDNDQAGRVSLNRAAFSGKEGTLVVVTVVRVGDPGARLIGNVSVSWSTTSGNGSAPTTLAAAASGFATPGVDYAPASGTVVFGPGETAKPITIALLRDDLLEGPEAFTLTLGETTGGATLGSQSSAVVTIIDDTPSSPVFLSQKNYRAGEGAGDVTITVRRSGGLAANASVLFTTSDGTASVEGEDYAPVNRRLTFGPNQTSASVVIPVSHSDLDKTFLVTLSAPDGTAVLGPPSSAVVTIAGTAAVLQFSGRLANSLPQVVRSGSLTANVSVQYQAYSGTATLGTDFILPTGTLFFPPGVTSRTIPVTIVDDNIAEGTETFTIALFNPSLSAVIGTNSSQVFSIFDNDFGGTVNFADRGATVSLGETKGITLFRVGGLGTVLTVDWAAVGGTAVAGTDFSPAAGSVTFAANESVRTFFVTIASTASAQAKNAVFGFSFPPGAARSGPANQSVLSIRPAPVLSFGAATYSAKETDGSVVITIVRDGDTSVPASVNYATSDGTATAGSDYTATSGTASFEVGQRTFTFTVPVLTDTIVEGNETVTLTLGNVSANAVLGSVPTAILTITDVPTYSFTSVQQNVAPITSFEFAPAINDSDTVSFYANLPDAVARLSTASDAVPTVVVETPDATLLSLTPFGNFPLDAAGDVVYLANLTAGGQVVAVGNRATGNSSTLFQMDSTYVTLAPPSVSPSGNVSFVATLFDGSQALLRGTLDGGFTPIVLTGNTSPFASLIAGAPPVNDAGWVAFRALGNNVPGGIFVTDGNSTTTVADDSQFFELGDFLSINSGGAVAFYGAQETGFGIYVGVNGSAPVAFALGAQGFASFVSDLPQASPAINDAGHVAFFAFVNGESEDSGIFNGPDPVANKIIQTGDSLFGSTVSSLQLGGINAFDEVVFRAVLADGRDFIVIGTPPAD